MALILDIRTSLPFSGLHRPLLYLFEKPLTALVFKDNILGNLWKHSPTLHLEVFPRVSKIKTSKIEIVKIEQRHREGKSLSKIKSF
jgi:hypothetical protein